MVIEWIGDVLAKGAVVAALLAAAGWLSKQQISAWLNKDLEREKTALQKDVEALKADFGRLHTEHSVRFTSLHAKRAEVIAELYSLLVRAMWASEQFLSPIEQAGEPSKRELSVAAQKCLMKTARYFERHRIYLPEAVCMALETMLRDIRHPVGLFSVYLRYEDDQLQDATYIQKLDAWHKGYQAMSEKIPAARKLLENEFRTLLGQEVAA